MIVPNSRVEGLTADGDLLVVIPAAFRDAARAVVNKCILNHSGFCRISLDRPAKPRTTGRGSQSAHLHGHLQQLAIHFGYDLAEMKLIMKDCVPEWPVEKRHFGKTVKLRPVSEATVSTIVESAGIEWCHRVAAEEGIAFVEE